MVFKIRHMQEDQEESSNAHQRTIQIGDIRVGYLISNYCQQVTLLGGRSRRHTCAFRSEQSREFENSKQVPHLITRDIY